MNEDILTELGLSSTEAKIYISLLGLGLSTVTEISKNTKLHRTNIYDSIKKLVNKGLASYIKKDGTVLYEANDPKALIRIIKEKENKLNDIMPQLLLSKKLASSSGEATVVEGLSAFMHLLYELLEYNDDIRVYGIPASVPEIVSIVIPHFHKERLKRKIKMLHIYNHNAKDRIKFLNKMELTQARYLPEEFDSEVSTFVCGDEIILTVWQKPITSISIKNAALAKAYKKYFKIIWTATKI